MRSKVLEDVKRAIREPYAWPGGYPVYTVMVDGELLCAPCARENYKLISRSTLVHAGTSWYDCWTAAGSMVLYEHDQAEDGRGMPPLCAHCNKVLAAAYAD